LRPPWLKLATLRSCNAGTPSQFPIATMWNGSARTRYAENLLSPSVVTRPLHGDVPTIDLVIGYNKSNTSALLNRFLSRVDEVVARVSQNARR
jgi:hypothetical protein